MKFLFYLFSIAVILLLSCTSTNKVLKNEAKSQNNNYNILSLGDSYTIGESVCETCRFPEQLKDSLSNNTKDTSFNLKIVATTGWTTTNLLNGISNENLPNNYDLVTLLIGVNNQYQGKDFSIYEKEFPELVDIAITKAKGDKKRVIVVSIPDYTYTPFGKENTTISSEIDTYNAFAENYCNANNITFVNITDITRNGLEDTDLVASDGLHPSKKAYSLFVERLLPYALEKL
ncbi:Lysophospholipase L1-related esterase [Mesoflavibacter sp. HG96]|uniref:SGNH/GDSL hydrolase family protein n=1 Tax=Mesoflavibacter profundi TaxID=2708110 RepID=A0ABT4S0S7_9FLAO|nr:MULTISPECIES: SGNH/GDSL hydrolase family protein [Mesoflavibacter]MDA0177647.1 SGNH/GDSL hydrolase family protein [Mesoflavibacter profundi]QIJ88602.1 Lysophospholipase L1-related esterase [Mesoflavibacter sp. HG96]QIJ91330.1 Lysophospholipase L1-related esterase [Mesoflavibacter sp. HG37]